MIPRPVRVVLRPTAAWSIDQSTGKVTTAFTGGLNLQGNSIENVSQILSANGTWSIDEQGKLVVKEVEAERVRSQKGYTVPDEDTGEDYCIKVKSGALIADRGTCGRE